MLHYFVGLKSHYHQSLVQYIQYTSADTHSCGSHTKCCLPRFPRWCSYGICRWHLNYKQLGIHYRDSGDAAAQQLTNSTMPQVCPLYPHTHHSHHICLADAVCLPCPSHSVLTFSRHFWLPSSLRCCFAAAPADAAAIGPAAPAQQCPSTVLQQRYAAMLSAGVLKPDQHQQQLVLQLSELLQQLQEYSRQVEGYRVSRAAYEVRCICGCVS